MFEKAELTLISMLSKMKKVITTPPPVLCSVASYKLFYSTTWNVGTLSLLFVPPVKGGGMEISMKHCVDNQRYGAVLALGIVSEYVVIYYENKCLCFYDVSESKIVFEEKVDVDEVIKVIILKRDFHIIKRNSSINIYTEKECISLMLHCVYMNECTRLKKTFYNGYSIEATYNCFFILRDMNSKIVMSEKHNNWVTDACIVGDMLYTVGYDSCIKKWSISKSTCEGYYALKNGWITAMTCGTNGLYIGNQFGEVLFVEYKEVGAYQLNKGAIWNIYNFYNVIYCVSEDGVVSLYNKKMKPVKGISCSNGWITAMAMNNGMLIAVSSYGEVFNISSDLTEIETLLNMEYWFNGVVIMNDIGYAVTAEGYIVKFNLFGDVIEVKKVSKYQLIDTVILDGSICTANVEGKLFIMDQNLNIKNEIDIPGVHITSMCYNEKQKKIYISTMDEVLVLVDANKNYKYRMVHIGRARSWKVDYSQQIAGVVLITTAQEIIWYDEELKHELMRKKCKEFFTTCKMIEDNVFCGDDKGEVKSYKFISERRIETEEYIPDWYKIDTQIYKKMVNCIILFYDGKSYSQLYKERDKKILELCGYSYYEVEIEENSQMQKVAKRCSGWSKFPQIIFYGHFISSASVLPQMFENRALKRCVESIEGEGFE